MTNYLTAQMDDIEAIQCPCGWTRRAFLPPEDGTASLHVVDIAEDAAVHYHKAITEIYLVLEGEGHMELDGDSVAVRPMSAILIQPGCRHHAVGDLRTVVVAIPAFDPDDEWLEEV